MRYTSLSEQELIDDIVHRHIAGNVPTDRSSNINNLRALASRDPRYMFGINMSDCWNETTLLELMHTKVGMSADPSFEHGQDYIDPLLTVQALSKYADVIKACVQAQGTFLFATGHPSCLAWIYAPLVRAVIHAGCSVIRLSQLTGSENTVTGTTLTVDSPEPGEVRQVEGIMMRYKDGSLMHTHESNFMDQIIHRLRATHTVPELVVADHGWAGAAGREGYRVIGIADCNDPALFVAEAQQEVEVCVPMDDGMPPSQLQSIISFILERAGLQDPSPL